jgi:competence protein ComEA
MKDTLRDLFTFSSGERKGIIALVFVLIVICGLNMILLFRHPVPVQKEYPPWMKDTGAFEEADNRLISHNDSMPELFMAAAIGKEQKKIIDPNTASLEDLILTGFSLRISRTIIRYREKGGRFKTPGDLKKIYGLSSETFQSVSPYIRINNDLPSKTKPGAELPATINLNTADSALFEKLPGIGPVLARRIIRYRAVLGGYYSPAQIREVYGVTDSLFLKISEWLEADTVHLKKLNLNTSSEKDLARHPYIGKYVAAGIVQYRSHAGKILNLNELLINGLISKGLFDQLKYYVSL